MKLLFVLAFMALYAHGYVSAGLTPEKAMEYASACRKEFNINDADLSKLIASETFDEINDSGKCFFNCFQEKEGTIVDGVVQEAAVLELLTSSVGEKKAREIFDICRNEKGDEKCETAFKLQMCYKKHGIF